MNHFVIKKSIDIFASAPRIWDVLTKPEFTKQYMYGCETVSQWGLGDDLNWKNKDDGQIYVQGKIMQIEAPHLLRYTTVHPETEVAGKLGYTIVTYQLETKNSYITLLVSQGDFKEVDDSEVRYQATQQGWDMLLPKIKELSESE